MPNNKIIPRNNNKHQSDLAKGGTADEICHLVNHKSSLFVSRKQ